MIHNVEELTEEQVSMVLSNVSKNYYNKGLGPLCMARATFGIACMSFVSSDDCLNCKSFEIGIEDVDDLALALTRHL